MREARSKVAPLREAVTVRRDATTLELDEVTADRQAEPQATVHPIGPRVSLAEALEQLREEIPVESRSRRR